jgi:hypothetical protein
VVLEPSEEERHAQQEQHVGDDRARNRRLHQHVLPGAQGGERDDQFGQVPERGVEQPAHRVTGLGRHRLGGMAQQRRQGHDGQHGQNEEQHARFGTELLCREHDGHEYQQPEERIVTNFVQ